MACIAKRRGRYVIDFYDSYSKRRWITMPKGTTKKKATEKLREIEDQLRTSEQKIARLPDSIKPGIWYEIYAGAGKPVRRLKLSVILQDTGSLVFVDRKGIKILEKDAEEFACEIKEERSRLLADHSTFDSALGKIIGSIAA